jgi:hypothetical protein
METANVGYAILLGGAIAILYLLHHKLSRSPLFAQKGVAQQAPARDKSRKRGVSLLLASAPDDEAEADIDIIAIHGLDTKAPDTWFWRAQGSKSKCPESTNADTSTSDGVNWLERPDMLPAAVGKARIYMCDWPADMFESSDLVQKPIEEFARLLLECLKRRPLPTGASAAKDRPLFFVALCLGGIILMKALVMATGPE